MVDFGLVFEFGVFFLFVDEYKRLLYKYIDSNMNFNWNGYNVIDS